MNERTMIKLYTKVRKSFWLQLFTLNLRTLLGIGFIIGGLRKVKGQPFANPGQGGPFFDFLDALHANVIYYEFIGWAQVVAGLLLITHHYASLGAVIYFPIILNIAVFTVFSIVSLTPWIASSMALGCLFLLLWDYHKWQALLFREGKTPLQLASTSFRKVNKIWYWNGWLSLLLPTLGMIILFMNQPENHEINSNSRIFGTLILFTILINVSTNVLEIYRHFKAR